APGVSRPTTLDLRAIVYAQHACHADESMQVLLKLSDALTGQAELTFKPWEGKAHSNTTELANDFEFKSFCEMAYNIWKHIIVKDPGFTSFPPAPGIYGLPVTDLFKPIVSLFEHRATHCKVPIMALRHIVTDLLEDAVKVFRDAVDTDGLNAVAELDLMAGVVFCGKGNPAPLSTVA
ncbi:hypothetical protein Cpir12675_003639, partial [Ceratocystis pirilliformis]